MSIKFVEIYTLFFFILFFLLLVPDMLQTFQLPYLTTAVNCMCPYVCARPPCAAGTQAPKCSAQPPQAARGAQPCPAHVQQCFSMTVHCTALQGCTLFENFTNLQRAQTHQRSYMLHLMKVYSCVYTQKDLWSQNWNQNSQAYLRQWCVLFENFSTAA